MLLCTAKEVLSKQTVFNNILCTEVSSKLFYSLTVMIFPTNSLNKTSKLLFIFVQVRKVHTLFQLEGISYIPGSQRGLYHCFSVVKQL